MVSIVVAPFVEKTISFPLNTPDLLVESWNVAEGGPFQAWKVDSCLTLGNELSKETHVLTEQETIVKGSPGKEQEGKGVQSNMKVPLKIIGRF